MLWLFALLGAAFLVTAPGWLLGWLVQRAYAYTEQQQARDVQAGCSTPEGAAYSAGQAVRFVTRIFGH